jgi:Amt family ammonium transporter
VHIASGAGALATSVYLSHPLFRSKRNKSRAVLLVDREHKPENLLQLMLSLVLIWGGWLAFDGGSTLALNLRSFVAMSTTQYSGSMGAFTWTTLAYIETGKWSLAGLVSGAICGLVGITPGCGYVGLPASLLVGFVTAATCYYADKLRHCSLAQRYNIVDPAGVFVSHCLGGIIGNCMTGIFAQASIAATDGATDIPGGWLDQNYRQLGLQLADCVATTTYAFVVTYLLVALIDCVPGLEVLATEEDILMGMDAAGCGESFYPEETRPFLPPAETQSSRSLDRQEKAEGEPRAEVVAV